MAKTDFKKVTIRQGRKSTDVNDKPIKSITLTTHDNKTFDIIWDFSNNALCIVASGRIDFLGGDENYFCFKIKRG